MTVRLEGQCQVRELREGEAGGAPGLRIYPHFGRHCGAQAISLRLLDLAPGTSPGLRNPAGCDDVLYVLDGQGAAYIDGWPFPLSPGTGVYLRAERSLTLENPGPQALVLVSARCPDPGIEQLLGEPATRPRVGSPAPEPAPVVDLWQREARPTADRWYRVLVDAALGCSAATQFVGAIPPGRAPDHFHEYEEVLVILEGEGRMWAGNQSTGIRPGSCVFLPSRQLHCVENTGSGELRLLGVLHPAGSPAVRYSPDASKTSEV